jgi:hypothetical protein
MSKPFHDLRERLLRAGVAPRHVRRYLAELSDHLADLRAEEERAGRSRADAESAALNRIGQPDDLAKAMIEQRQFQSWCVRAPWAMFGLAPLLLLAGAWFVALFILWSGWNIFLPGAETPFGVHAHGLANLYFQLGRSIYLNAPILVGWGIMLIAARQRLKALWPVAGLVLVALIGGTGRVHVSRPGGLYHVGMGFTLAPGVQGSFFGLTHTLVLLAITGLPYVFWRLQSGYCRSA